MSGSGLKQTVQSRTMDGVILFFLPGIPNVVIWITLFVALWLTYVELRVLKPHWLWWMWWFLLVFLTHFIGLFILRGYIVYRRRKSPPA